MIYGIAFKITEEQGGKKVCGGAGAENTIGKMSIVVKTRRRSMDFII